MSSRRSPGLSRSLRQIMSSLSRLRAGEVVVPVGLEVRAGVDHLRIEEEPVELVRHVVVIGDVRLVGRRVAVAGAGLVLRGGRAGAACRPGARRNWKAVFSALSLLDALQAAPDLALRALRREIEDGAVLQVEQPRHIGVEQRCRGWDAARGSRSRSRARIDEPHAHRTADRAGRSSRPTARTRTADRAPGAPRSADPGKSPDAAAPLNRPPVLAQRRKRGWRWKQPCDVIGSRNRPVRNRSPGP